MTEPSSSDSHHRLLHKLSPWTDTLRGKLSLPINDAAPHSTELTKKLWIQIRVPPTSDADVRWVPQATLVREHIQWVQALRLLDLLARIDNRLCWELIIDLCGARENLRTLGCPLEFLMEVRPRFELVFDEGPAPSDQMMKLLLDENQIRDEDGGGGFTDLMTDLLPRIGKMDGPPVGPTSLRLHFELRAREQCRDCRTSGCDVFPVSYLTQVVSCAHQIEKLDTIEKSHFQIQCFGFDLQRVCANDATCELLRQIGCKIPFDILKYSRIINYNYCSDLRHDAKWYSPFVWRMLAPHDNARAHLGLRRLDLARTSSWSGDAVCSAVHSSRTLQKLSFGKAGYTSWLAFALFSKTAQHKISTLHLDCGQSASLYATSIECVINRENNVEGYYPSYPIQWPPRTIRVNAQTKIHISPYRYPRPSRPTTVYHGKRTVDCLQVGTDDETTGHILIPGVGIDYVARKDVVSRQPAATRKMHTIRNLTLTCGISSYTERYTCKHYFDTTSVAKLLRLIGEPLEQLTIECNEARPKEPLYLDELLAHCPNLKSLKLINFKLSAEQLFVSKHGRALQSLTLLKCHLIDKPRRMGCVFYVAPFTFPRLTSLYFDSSGAAESDYLPELPTVYDYILELAIRRRLHRLVVRCSDGQQRARFAPHLARCDGELIPVLPRREKLAFLSVVTVGCSASSTTKYELTTDVAALIFEMASTTMWQRRVWTLLK